MEPNDTNPMPMGPDGRGPSADGTVASVARDPPRNDGDDD